MLAYYFLILLCAIGLSSGTAIPIWELLTREEKLGRLMFLFVHLVGEYCRSSSIIPGCQKVLALYGLSNLVNEEEDELDKLDPYQRDSRTIIWTRVMKGDFNPGLLVPESSKKEEEERDFNDLEGRHFQQTIVTTKNQILQAVSDPHPHAVRVPAPAHLLQQKQSLSTSPFALQRSRNRKHKRSSLNIDRKRHISLSGYT